MMKKRILTLFMTAALLAGCGSAETAETPAEEPAAPAVTAAAEPYSDADLDWHDSSRRIRDLRMSTSRFRQGTVMK